MLGMTEKNLVISVVLTPDDKGLLGKLRTVLDRRLGVRLPITQIVRLGLRALAQKERVK
jgi:hypothetical protein